MYTFDSFHISFNPWTVALWTLKHMWIAHVKISWLLVNDCFLFTCFRELLITGDTDLATLSSSDVSAAVSVWSLSRVWLFATPWIAARQASLSITTAGVHPNPRPLNQWCHPPISSSVIPFFFCPQSFPSSGSFQMSQLFASGGQSIGVSASASVLPMSTQDWFSLGWTSWISLQSKGLSRVFSNTTVQKHKFFSTQLSS